MWQGEQAHIGCLPNWGISWRSLLYLRVWLGLLVEVVVVGCICCQWRGSTFSCVEKSIEVCCLFLSVILYKGKEVENRRLQIVVY